MRPLKDHDSPASPIEADAADLLRAAVKYDPAPGQKQRVRARILAHGAAGHHGLRFRTSVVAGVVLFGAVASAAAGRHWIERMTASPGGGKSDSRSSEDLLAPRVPLRQRAAGRIAMASANAAADGTAGPGSTPLSERTSPAERLAITRRSSSAGGHVHIAARRGAAVGKGGPVDRGPIGANAAGVVGADVVQERNADAVARTPPAADRSGRVRRSDDSSLVFDAVRALRQDRAPVHALELLQEYSQLHPRGPLAEEVLALSIEAATMCGDPRAQALIDQYLSRYPTGHFRAAVETSRARLSR